MKILAITLLALIFVSYIPLSEPYSLATGVHNTAADVPCAYACGKWGEKLGNPRYLCGNFQLDCCIGKSGCDKGFFKTTCYKGAIMKSCSELKKAYPQYWK